MEIPKNLKDSLQQRLVIPFVGAGVSMAVLSDPDGRSLFPSWRALLTQAEQRLEEEKKKDDADMVRILVSKNRFLDAAKEARQALGAIWYEFLKQQIDKRMEDAEPDSLHLARLVWQLGSSLVITTNYDKVLRWACPDVHDIAEWDIEAPAEQCDLLRNGVTHPTVWHLHGKIDNAARIILTPDGYERLYPDGNGESRYQAALDTLRHQLSSRSFLFIGFSLTDDYFANQLKYVEEVFHGAAGPHYVLLPETQRGQFQSRATNVEPLFFSDFGEPQRELLRQLAEIAKSEAKSETVPLASGEVGDYNPSKPAFNVPFQRKGAEMVGRQDALKQVRRQLCNGKRTSIGQTASFQGLGGLGKTQLAVEYAYEYRDTYPNGVIWINADQDIIAQIIKLAEDARWVSPLSEQAFKLEAATKRLREYSDCLIIFDNLETLESIQEFLPATAANPHILVTSRLEQPGFPPGAPGYLDPGTGSATAVAGSGKNAT